MKVLITGGTGFVGKTLVPYLYSNGYTDLCLLVRNPSKAYSLFNTIPLKVISNQFNNWRDKLIEYNPDVIIHLATCPNHHNDYESIRMVAETNIVFTSLLLEASSKTVCKYFVNVGTFTEYLYGIENFVANNYYSASKTAVRPIIKFWQSQSEWKWINIIPYSPYGRYNETTKVFDLIYSSIKSHDPIKLSEGKQILDFIHVDDIADFFLNILQNLDCFNEDYTQLYLGTGKGHSLREVSEIMESVTLGRTNILWGAIPYRPMDTMYAIAPVDNNPQWFPWRAKITLEEGIRIYINDVERR